MDFDDWLVAQLPWLLRLTTALCGPDVAEDVAQNVAIRAHRNWPRIRSMEHPQAYVRRMVINEHLSFRRRWGRAVPVEFVDHGVALLDHLVSTPDHARQLADRSALISEIGRLTPTQRTVIVLRYLEDLDDASIAEAMGCPPSTVRSHALRALTKLRVQLNEIEQDIHAH